MNSTTNQETPLRFSLKVKLILSLLFGSNSGLSLHTDLLLSSTHGAGVAWGDVPSRPFFAHTPRRQPRLVSASSVLELGRPRFKARLPY